MFVVLSPTAYDPHVKLISFDRAATSAPGWFTRADATCRTLTYYAVTATPNRSGTSVNCGCLATSVSIAAALRTCS